MDDAMATAGDGHPARGGVVCVTGGSGFIGSWLVRYLLDRGYSVHATVRNIQDEGETMHLHALDGAGTRLRLFQIDLLDLPSIRAAIEGAQGVFHLASPLIVQTQDPEHWYGVSKTLAEKAAWDFAAEEGLQLVVLNPGLVLGPFLTPSVNASLNWFLQLLSGKRLDMDMYMGYVDVRDVATSLVTLYETPSPQGRHLCMESIERMVDFTDKVVDLYPEFSVPRIMEDKQSWIVRAKVASKKLISLGILFTPFEKTINDTVECFKSKGLI
ncbi:unnamed protein product [Urochloa decumbens]|uniref:NAD-dependent epimerase/dehydratase domain-containing protein n=1 Tax=Urochloa decumbens TaxID=240449 RepID=A0ABC9GFT5_9POAL